MEKLLALLSALSKLPGKLFIGPLGTYKRKSKHTDQKDLEWSLDRSVAWVGLLFWVIIHFVSKM